VLQVRGSVERDLVLVVRERSSEEDSYLEVAVAHLEAGWVDVWECKGGAQGSIQMKTDAAAACMLKELGLPPLRADMAKTQVTRSQMPSIL
jgi:hypothetical protein